MTSLTWTPNERYIDPETGLEYQDKVERFLRCPKATRRNGFIEALRESRYPEIAIRAYWEAYDGCHPHYAEIGFPQEHDVRHSAGLTAARSTGTFGPGGKPVEPPYSDALAYSPRTR